MKVHTLASLSVAVLALLASTASASSFVRPKNQHFAQLQAGAGCQQVAGVSYDCPAPPVPTINWGDAFYVDSSAAEYEYLDACCYIHFMPGPNGQRAWNLTGFNVTTDPLGDELI